MVGKIKDYEFQTQCVEYLIDKTVETSSKQVITVKAPTTPRRQLLVKKYYFSLYSLLFCGILL